MRYDETRMWREIREQPGVFRTLLAEAEAPVGRLLEALRDRHIRSVLIAARGTSDHAATYAKYLFEVHQGIPVSLAAPSVLTLYGGRLSLADCFVIGISQSGRAADVMELLARAEASGGVVASLTNDPDSPMARMSRFHLPLSAGPETSVAATKTFGAQLFLLALLAARWSGDQAFLDRLTALPERLEGLADALAGACVPLVERFRTVDAGFVLARGYAYPIALETALKIQETNYIRMKGYSIADFQHGPMAMLAPDVPVLLYAVRGPALPDALGMAERIRSTGAPLHVVTDDPDVLPGADVRILLPALSDPGDDRLAVFGLALFAQVFACRLSTARGLDPDSPRMLRKVTVTR